eukprot:3289101-Pleurochrysis_carterae.AAC.1
MQIESQIESGSVSERGRKGEKGGREKERACSLQHAAMGLNFAGFYLKGADLFSLQSRELDSADQGSCPVLLSLKRLQLTPLSM